MKHITSTNVDYAGPLFRIAKTNVYSNSHFPVYVIVNANFENFGLKFVQTIK